MNLEVKMNSIKMDSIKLWINNVEVEAEPGLSIMDAADLTGVHIPRLCYHPSLKPSGACRVCAVEIEGSRLHRGLEELCKWNQLDRDKVVALGQACSEDLAAGCECWKPFPDRLDYGSRVAPVSRGGGTVEKLHGMQMEERLDWWLGRFKRCIRCHGCRDVCPVCFCTECSLEHMELIPGAKLPPDTSFHLVRAVHMAGRCVDCGLCEEICPARVPLRSLYKEVNQLVEEIFGYKPGAPGIMSPFTFLGDELLLPQGPR